MISHNFAHSLRWSLLASLLFWAGSAQSNEYLLNPVASKIAVEQDQCLLKARDLLVAFKFVPSPDGDASDPYRHIISPRWGGGQQLWKMQGYRASWGVASIICLEDGSAILLTDASFLRKKALAEALGALRNSPPKESLKP